jgi:hypothetical protein
MKRLSNGRYLKERQLGPYMEHYRSRRLSPTLDDFHPIEYKDKPHEPIPRLPFFDKVAGCMSSSIDAAALLIKHNRWVLGEETRTKDGRSKNLTRTRNVPPKCNKQVTSKQQTRSFLTSIN